MGNTMLKVKFKKGNAGFRTLERAGSKHLHTCTFYRDSLLYVALSNCMYIIQYLGLLFWSLRNKTYKSLSDGAGILVGGYVINNWVSKVEVRWQKEKRQSRIDGECWIEWACHFTQ
jgi:hypothetical protein